MKISQRIMTAIFDNSCLVCGVEVTSPLTFKEDCKLEWNTRTAIDRAGKKGITNFYILMEHGTSILYARYFIDLTKKPQKVYLLYAGKVQALCIENLHCTTEEKEMYKDITDRADDIVFLTDESSRVNSVRNTIYIERNTGNIIKTHFSKLHVKQKYKIIASKSFIFR